MCALPQGASAEGEHMDLGELIEACREVAGGDTPTRDVAELVGAFLHQPDLSSLLGDGDRSTYEALYRGDDILVLHGVVPPRPRRSRPTTIACGPSSASTRGSSTTSCSSGTRVAASTPWIASPSPPARYGSWIRRRSTRCRPAVIATSGDPRLRRRSLRDTAQHVDRRRRMPVGRVGTAGLLRQAPPPRDRARTPHDAR